MIVDEQHDLQKAKESVYILQRGLSNYPYFSAAVIVLWLGGIVSVVCCIELSKGCKPFM